MKAASGLSSAYGGEGVMAASNRRDIVIMAYHNSEASKKQRRQQRKQRLKAALSKVTASATASKAKNQRKIFSEKWHRKRRSEK